MEYGVFKLKFLLALTFQCLIISAASFDKDINFEDALEYVLAKVFTGRDASEYDAMKEEVIEHALDLLDGVFALAEDYDVELDQLDQNLKEKFSQEFSEEKLESFVESVFGTESEITYQVKKENSSAIRDRILELLDIFLGEDSPSRRKRASEDNTGDDIAGQLRSFLQGFLGRKTDDGEQDLDKTKKGFELRSLPVTINQSEGQELGVLGGINDEDEQDLDKMKKRFELPFLVKESTFTGKIKEFYDLVHGTTDQLMGFLREKSKIMSNYGKKVMEQGRNTMEKYQNDFKQFMKIYSNDLVDLMKRFGSQITNIAGKMSLKNDF